jgi:hypothetical protein
MKNRPAGRFFFAVISHRQNSIDEKKPARRPVFNKAGLITSKQPEQQQPKRHQQQPKQPKRQPKQPKQRLQQRPG